MRLWLVSGHLGQLCAFTLLTYDNAAARQRLAIDSKPLDPDKRNGRNDVLRQQRWYFFSNNSVVKCCWCVMDAFCAFWQFSNPAIPYFEYFYPDFDHFNFLVVAAYEFDDKSFLKTPWFLVPTLSHIFRNKTLAQHFYSFFPHQSRKSFIACPH